MKFILTAILLCCISSFHESKISWTAIGDSITYLNDHLDETGNRVTSGYMSRVVKQLPDIRFINQGHNGWTTVGIAREIEHLGLIKTDLYSVFLGTNDWWQGLPTGTLSDYKNNSGLNTTCGAYRIIINKIRVLNPAAKIILITPMQRGDFVYIHDAHNNAWGSYKPKNNQSLSGFADAVNAIGAYEHFPVVDLYYKSGIRTVNAVKFKRLKDSVTGAYSDYTYPNYIGIPFNPEKDQYPYPPEAIDYTYDGLHPSDKGYQTIANMLIPILKTYAVSFQK